MKFKWFIAAAFVHIALGMYETVASYLIGGGDGRFGTVNAIARFVNAFTPYDAETGTGGLYLNLNVWTTESIRGSIINGIGATYDLVTFGGYATFLGGGSGIEWLSAVPALYGHAAIAYLIFRLASVIISSVIGIIR